MALVVAVTGCGGGTAFDPGLLPGPPAGGGGTGGGGGGGGGSADLVGRWRNELLCAPQLPGCPGGDVIRVVTTWTFDAGGACARDVLTYSVASDLPLASRTGCAWQTGLADQLFVTYENNADPVTFTWRLALGDPVTLLLGGLPFVRVG